MSRGITVWLVICFGWVFSVAHAEVPIQTITRIADVQRFVESTLIKKEHIPPHRILVVFDDDNTLLTTPKHCPTPEAVSCQYLGSVVWERWQIELLKNDPYSADLLAKTEEKLYRIKAFLFSIIPLELIEPDSVRVFQALQKQHVTVMIETARDPGESLATFRQLLHNHLRLNKHPSINSLANDNVQARQCGQTGWGDQPVAMDKGVFYVSGRDKGKMLSCLLHHSNGAQQYQAIVMVDDEAQNLKHVGDALDKHYHVSLFRYARLDQQVAAFLTGPKSVEYKAQATLRWHRIVKALKEALPVLDM